MGGPRHSIFPRYIWSNAFRILNETFVSPNWHSIRSTVERSPPLDCDRQTRWLGLIHCQTRPRLHFELWICRQVPVQIVRSVDRCTFAEMVSSGSEGLLTQCAWFSPLGGVYGLLNKVDNIFALPACSPWSVCSLRKTFAG